MRYLILLEEPPMSSPSRFRTLQSSPTAEDMENARRAAVDAIRANIEAYEETENYGKKQFMQIYLKEKIGNPDLFSGRKKELQRYLQWIEDIKKRTIQKRGHSVPAENRKNRSASPIVQSDVPRQ